MNDIFDPDKIMSLINHFYENGCWEGDDEFINSEQVKRIKGPYFEQSSSDIPFKDNAFSYIRNNWEHIVLRNTTSVNRESFIKRVIYHSFLSTLIISKKKQKPQTQK